jgi:hypothetical protein
MPNLSGMIEICGSRLQNDLAELRKRSLPKVTLKNSKRSLEPGNNNFSNWQLGSP